MRFSARVGTLFQEIGLSLLELSDHILTAIPENSSIIPRITNLTLTVIPENSSIIPRIANLTLTVIPGSIRNPSITGYTNILFIYL